MSIKMPWHGTAVEVMTGKGRRTISVCISADRLQQLVDLYEQTGTVNAAAKAAGMNRRTAHNYLARLGILPERPYTQKKTTYTATRTGRSIITLYPWGTVHTVVTLYLNEELSTRQIEARTGINHDTIRTWFEGLGIARTHCLQNRINSAKRHGFKNEAALSREVERLWVEHNCSTDEVAKTLNIDRSCVIRLIRRVIPRKRNPLITMRTTEAIRVRTGRPARAYRSGKADQDKRYFRRLQVDTLNREGMTVIDMAKRFDVSIATIYHDLAWLRKTEALRQVT